MIEYFYRIPGNDAIDQRLYYGQQCSLFLCLKKEHFETIKNVLVGYSRKGKKRITCRIFFYLHAICTLEERSEQLILIK